jgi:hypothetical protein
MRWLGIYVLVFSVLGAVVPAPDRCDSSDNWFYVLAGVGLLGAMAGGYAVSVSRHGNRSSRAARTMVADGERQRWRRRAPRLWTKADQKRRSPAQGGAPKTNSDTTTSD